MIVYVALFKSQLLKHPSIKTLKIQEKKFKIIIKKLDNPNKECFITHLLVILNTKEMSNVWSVQVKHWAENSNKNRSFL